MPADESQLTRSEEVIRVAVAQVNIEPWAEDRNLAKVLTCRAHDRASYFEHQAGHEKYRCIRA